MYWILSYYDIDYNDEDELSVIILTRNVLSVVLVCLYSKLQCGCVVLAFSVDDVFFK